MYPACTPFVCVCSESEDEDAPDPLDALVKRRLKEIENARRKRSVDGRAAAAAPGASTVASTRKSATQRDSDSVSKVMSVFRCTLLQCAFVWLLYSSTRLKMLVDD